MGSYNPAVITNAGRDLIAAAIAGSVALTFTAVKTSTHVYPSGATLANLAALDDIVQTVAPSSVAVYNGSVVQVASRFSNTGISTAYLINTLGVYGQITEGAETLIAVITATTADEVPEFNPASPAAFIFNIQMTIADASSVTFEVNDTATATAADVMQVAEVFTGATALTDGDPGRVPAPLAGDNDKFLCGNGSWDTPTDTTYTTVTTESEGLMPVLSGDSADYMRGDGTWGAVQANITTATPGLPLDATIGKALAKVYLTTLPAASWTGTAPYTQTVTVAGMTAEYAPVISYGNPASMTAANFKAVKKAFAMIDRAVTGANAITFYCYNKKPGVDIPIRIKGV